MNILRAGLLVFILSGAVACTTTTTTTTTSASKVSGDVGVQYSSADLSRVRVARR